MTNVDHAALHRAMKIASQDPATAEQLQSKLQDEPWHEVAAFAAYGCQQQSLNLPPWEDPPCFADEEDPHPPKSERKAQKLLKQMLAAGLSRYHPDPLAALERQRK